jgi:hypothetical protein
MLPSDNADRLSDLVRFYNLLERLEERVAVGGCHLSVTSHGVS